MTQATTDRYFGRDLEAMTFARNYHRWLIDGFSPYLGGSVAEVGAGVGNVSKLILDADIDRLTAFEPSGNMFPILKQRLESEERATVVNGFFGRGIVSDEAFDTILYVNVLEHIEDDASELAGVHAALAEHGHLLIFVPALPWLYSELDRQVGHFRRYTRDGLVALVRQAGFSVVRARYFDIAGILPWYINFTLLKNPINGASVSLYDRLVVPAMRVVERVVPPPTGKNLLLVASKGRACARPRGGAADGAAAEAVGCSAGRREEYGAGSQGGVQSG